MQHQLEKQAKIIEDLYNVTREQNKLLKLHGIK